MEEKMVLSVQEVSKALGIGINQTYALVKKKEFPSVRVGHKYLIPKKEFQNWLSSGGKETI